MAEVALDINTFKALSSETRIAIIKQLAERRKSASELASALGITSPSAAQHLDRLCEAQLVRRIDGGSKWVYYELTEKGGAVLGKRGHRLPPASFLIALAISIIALAAILNYGALQRYAPFGADALGSGQTQNAAPEHQELTNASEQQAKAAEDVPPPPPGASPGGSAGALANATNSTDALPAPSGN